MDDFCSIQKFGGDNFVEEVKFCKDGQCCYMPDFIYKLRESGHFVSAAASIPQWSVPPRIFASVVTWNPLICCFICIVLRAPMDFGLFIQALACCLYEHCQSFQRGG